MLAALSLTLAMLDPSQPLPEPEDPLASPPAATPASVPPEPERAPLLRPVTQYRPWAVSSEAALAILSNRGQLGRAWSFGIGALRRTQRWGIGVSVDVNTWRSPTLAFGRGEWLVALNPGVQAEYRFVQGFARTAIELGPSIVLREPAIDDSAGAVGVFLDLRPLGLRWQVAEDWALGLDPLGFRLLVPDLSGIPLVEIQYMTTLRLEWLP